MSDIVLRLRAWVYAVDAVSASDLMDEAADEIERLRRQFSSQQNLTAKERWAIESAAHDADAQQHGMRAATLRALLERTK